MKIYLASDHAGFELKNELLDYIVNTLHYEIFDCGAATLEPEDDYPALIAKAARMVSADASIGIESRGIVLGGSGTGEAIVANKFRGVRAAVFYGGSDEIIRLSREHNDANVLSLGARFLSPEEARHAVELWLSTPFSAEERHMRRIDEIEKVAHE